MTASSRRQKHNEELRRLILDASREIFVSHGYESFSMRKLAKKIEYSPGSVYLHFKNKEELFERLVDESFARLHKTLLALRNRKQRQDPVEELKKGLRAYVDFGLRNPNDYRFAFMLRPPIEKRPYKVHAAFDALRSMVQRCLEEGRFREVNVDSTSQALWASAHGVTSLLIQRPRFPWAPKNELIAQIIATAIDGLVAGASTSAQPGERHVHVRRF
jgi:AcrR family transcriptional regulator